jgi:hypothetical protein
MWRSGYAVLVDRNPDWIMDRLQRCQGQLKEGQNDLPVAFEDDNAVYGHFAQV